MTLRDDRTLALREVVRRARGWARASVPERRRRASIELMAAVGRLERIERSMGAALQDEPETRPRMATLPFGPDGPRTIPAEAETLPRLWTEPDSDETKIPWPTKK